MHSTAWCLGLALLASAAQAGGGQEPLSFGERVKAQEAIERVFHARRIWPKENPGPKPAFEEVVSPEDLKAKVASYVESSEALERLQPQALRGETLEAELARMERDTKDPATLRELFDALGNDRCLLAECLAKPALTGRLLMRIGASGEDGFEVPSGLRPEACAESWTPTNTGGAPAGRINHTAVWTGAEMIVWGGVTGGSMPSFTYTNTGGCYVPATDSWSATPTAAPCPTARGMHSAVWTGTEMIVWGGVTSSSYLSISCTNSGGRFNPATGSWTATHTSGVPTGRGGHGAVWTGSVMTVWGGLVTSSPLSMSYTNTGSRYSPSAGTWTATSTTDAPSARAMATAVWTGTEMVVWGGGNGSYPNLVTTNTGGAYRLSDDTWRATSTAGDCPTARGGHTAVWTGTEMIVWGGGGASNTNTGARYVPSPEAWTATSTAGACPVPRSAHTALWTGSAMFVWGGALSGSYPDYVYTNTGGLYDPAGDGWRATGTGAGCPTARGGHCAVWQNGKAILWGGQAPYTGTGAAYEPLTVCATTEVSPTGAAFPARLLKDGASPTGYSLNFQRVDAATGYDVYEGTVGGWYDHGSGAICGAPSTDLGTGEMRAEITPSEGNRYYLITARDAVVEGVSGYDSSGVPIPASQSTCPP